MMAAMRLLRASLQSYRDRREVSVDELRQRGWVIWRRGSRRGLCRASRIRKLFHELAPERQRFGACIGEDRPPPRSAGAARHVAIEPRPLPRRVVAESGVPGHRAPPVVNSDSLNR